jgi:hemoglobin
VWKKGPRTSSQWSVVFVIDRIHMTCLHRDSQLVVRTVSAIGFCLSAAAVQPVLAGTASMATTGPAAALPAAAHASDSLYRAFGKKAGLVALMGDFVKRLRVDPRTAEQFADVDVPKLQSQLVDQFCELAGGPCKLHGHDMKAVHKGLGIRKSDFNALVEILQQSMDAHDISFAAQNRMLALLAPMHRDIIEK